MVRLGFRATYASIFWKLLPAPFLLFSIQGFATDSQTDLRLIEEPKVAKSYISSFSLVGRFERSDGGVVRAGIRKSSPMGGPPTSCMFVFPDGTVALAGTKLGDCLVQINGSAAEIYRYESTSLVGRLLPFADRVQRFNGYGLEDVTTPEKRLFSALVHIRTYRDAYLGIAFYLGLLALLHFAGKMIKKANPKQWWLMLSLSLGNGARLLLMIVIIASLPFQMLGMINHTLPSVNVVLLGIGLVLYKQIDRFVQQRLKAQKA